MNKVDAHGRPDQGGKQSSSTRRLAVTSAFFLEWTTRIVERGARLNSNLLNKGAFEQRCKVRPSSDSFECSMIQRYKFNVSGRCALECS